MSCEHQWKAAISWVQSNHTLVGCISAPYRRYMASGYRDVEQEAILTAFCTLSILAEKEVHDSWFGAYFRVNFRTRCIKIATGGMGSSFNNIDHIPSSPPEQKIDELDHEIIEKAFQKMSNRQRQISVWILAQPTPVSTTTVGQKFGIQSRTVRAILQNAIRRIENYGYQSVRVRKEFATAA